MKFVVGILLTLNLTFAALARDVSKHAMAIRKLEFLVGTWKGEGWIKLGPKKKEEFKGVAKVSFGLGGSILIIEGEHFDKHLKKPSNDQVPVHQALGIISYNPKDTTYTFQTYLRNGQERRANVKAEKNGMVWFYQDSKTQRHIRFSIRLDNQGDWYEIGESSGDGKTWFRFFEMRLSKVS